MTQQPWGGAPDQWNRTQAPWGGQQTWGQQPSPLPAQQGFPQYPGYGQGGGYPTPPRRRRSPFGALLRTVIMIALILFAVSILRSVLAGMAGSDGPTTQTTTQGRPTSTSTSGTGASGTSGTNTSGSAGSGTGSGTAEGTGTAQYQNEGYQAPPADFNPPDLPAPQTYSEAQSLLTSNPIYKLNVPSPTHCTMTPISGSNTAAQLETKLNDQMACLMAVWEPPLRDAGFEMPRPPVTVYTSPVTTACGVMKEINAAYCAGDQHVYYAAKLLQALPQKVSSTKYAAETVIAHEFGHAVQARTAILISDKALEQKASKNDALVMSRRTEQQADCFGALYVESVAQSQGLSQADLQGLVNMTYYLGDDVLSGDPSINEGHGLGKSRQAWYAKGVQTTAIGTCNTWTVPAAQVR